MDKEKLKEREKLIDVTWSLLHSYNGISIVILKRTIIADLSITVVLRKVSAIVACRCAVIIWSVFVVDDQLL